MFTPSRLRLIPLGVLLAMGWLVSACVPDIAPPALSIPAQDQEVPTVLAIGPVDTAKVTYDGEPLGENLEAAIQHTLRDTLLRTHTLKDVVVLSVPHQAGKPGDSEQVLAAARQKQADLLLVGEVTEFQSEVPVALFGSRYEVMMYLQLQLYNVPTSAQVWKKTQKVTISKDGSSIRRKASLESIVKNVAVPSATAGLLPGLLDHLQTDYLASMRGPAMGRIGVITSTLFGGAELAKLDAELAPPATKVAPKDHAYAVIVGIEEYRDLPKVDYAKRDAEMVKQYLTKSLGYREQNVVMLLNDRATRSQLSARLEKWLHKQVADHKGSEVFVYYGGHGAPDPNTNQAFLVPYDGDPAFLEETGYPLKHLYKVLGDLPAKQVTVVMDSCFSGAGGRSVIAKGTRPMLVTIENPLLASQNMVVLSAAAGNQISSAFPEKRHGLFTYYFLKGLQGEADANRDGAVDIEELYDYLRPQVETAARRANAEQSPQLLPSTDVLGERAKLHMIDLKR